MPKELVSISATARSVGVSERTVRRWISQGLIPGHRVGPKLIRVDPADVEAMLHRIPTADPAA